MKILYAFLITAITVGLFYRCTDEVQPEHLCGAYTSQRDLSEEETALFRKVVGDMALTPISVATQVVAGINYKFLCSCDDGTEKSQGHCFVIIYQPLQGEPVLSAIQYETENGADQKVIK